MSVLRPRSSVRVHFDSNNCMYKVILSSQFILMTFKASFQGLLKDYFISAVTQVTQTVSHLFLFQKFGSYRVRELFCHIFEWKCEILIRIMTVVIKAVKYR